MHSFNVAKFELRYIAGLRSFKLVSFVDNLAMILVDERILSSFFKLV